MTGRLLAAVAAAFVPLLASAHELHFAAKPVVASPKCPFTQLNAVDVNHDGKLDLLSLTSDHQLIWLPGHGDGTFDETCRTLTTTPVASILAVGDVDGDGVPDIVAAQLNAPVVQIFRGTASGALSTPESFTLPQPPRGAAIGDVNGDGRPDIAVSWYEPKTTSGGVVLLMNGGAHFTTGPQLFFWRPRKVALADFDGDGNIDVIAAADVGAGPSVQYYRGHGDGTFDQFDHPGTHGDADALIDLNGDGVPDLVHVADGIISCVISNRTKYNVPTVTTPLGTGLSPQFVDVDGDGLADCLVTGSNTVQLRKGRGDGTFDTSTTFFVSSNGITAAAGDFDGDGKKDVVISGSLFLPGNGDGTFRYPGVPYSDYLVAKDPLAIGMTGMAATAADMTEDGRPDVVTAWTASEGGGRLRVYENVDGQHFVLRASVALPAMTGRAAIAVADFDGDGHLDVAVSGRAIAFGDGKGGLTAPVAVIAPAEMIGTGSFAGGRQHQIVYVGATTIIAQPARDGALTTLTEIAGHAMAVADIDGDGRSDLFSSAPQGIFFNDWPAFTFVPHAGGVFLDLDGDGVADFVGDPGDDYNTVTVIQRNLRDRTAATPQRLLSFLRPDFVADFDGDGKLDLIDRGNIYLNRGDGTYDAVEKVPSAEVADFDGDGRADLLTFQGDGVVVVLNRPQPLGTEKVTLSFVAYNLVHVAAPNGTPDGLITWRDKGTIIGYSATNTPGIGTLFEAGHHVLTASYSGDTTFAPSSAETAFDVEKLPTVLSFSRLNGNYARLPIEIPMYLQTARKVGGTVTLTIDGTTHIEKVITVPAARSMKVSVSLPAGDYRYWAEFSGDTNYLAVYSNVGGSVSVIDPPVAFDKTTFTSTKTAHGYDVEVTFRDVSGTPLSLPFGHGFIFDLTASAGSLMPVQQPFAPENPLHWTLSGAPTNVPVKLTISIGGVPVATGFVGAPPPRRRAAGH